MTTQNAKWKLKMSFTKELEEEGAIKVESLREKGFSRQPGNADCL